MLIVGVLSAYSWILPRTANVESIDSTPKIETTFDYKAKVSPNVLHPNGGTVEVGPTLFKNITTAIPFHLKSIISSKQGVVAKGTYNVQLLIKAGDNWEKAIPLQGNKNFEQTGTNLSIIDSSYSIDLKQVEAFILQVEAETGVVQSQYELEVVPTLQGVIQFGDIVRDIDLRDTLKFTYLSKEINLASEKKFSTAIQFNESQTIADSISFLGLSFPLIPFRITSAVLFLLLLLSIIFSLVYLDEGAAKVVKSEAEKINKKYRKRVIRISRQVNFEGKTIVSFEAFKSMLKISDEIEQPILFYVTKDNQNPIYFIVDVLCVYTYVPDANQTQSTLIKDNGNGNAYVVS